MRSNHVGGLPHLFPDIRIQGDESPETSSAGRVSAVDSARFGLNRGGAERGYSEDLPTERLGDLDLYDPPPTKF